MGEGRGGRGGERLREMEGGSRKDVGQWKEERGDEEEGERVEEGGRRRMEE